jgi:hypothetical protein
VKEAEDRASHRETIAAAEVLVHTNDYTNASLRIVPAFTHL